MITIQLNGESREVPEGQNVSSLIESLRFPADRVAVELNGEVLPRNHWAETPLEAGDRLEVVHFVGGGLPEQGAGFLRPSC